MRKLSVLCLSVAMFVALLVTPAGADGVFENPYGPDDDEPEKAVPRNSFLPNEKPRCPHDHSDTDYYVYLTDQKRTSTWCPKAVWEPGGNFNVLKDCDSYLLAFVDSRGHQWQMQYLLSGYPILIDWRGAP